MAGQLASGGGRPSDGRRVLAVALVLGVAVVHGCVIEQLVDRLGRLDAARDAPKRIQVAYVRELDFAPPPAAAPVARPVLIAKPVPARRHRVREAPPPVVQAAASEPSAEPVIEPAAEAASAAAPVEAAASAASEAAAASAPAVEAVAASAASPPLSDKVWPTSTRVSYVLEGNYRGEIHGTAQVEWARAGIDHYQVHLDVTVGLSFAPLFTRSMTSEGRITAEGLYPERFDQDGKLAFHTRQRLTERFEADAVVMPDGTRLARPVGLQDSASQFIQIAFLLTRQPQLAMPGASIELPLALPGRLSRYLYDVTGSEPVSTRFGSIEAVHLTPRRAVPAPGELAVEIWFAPSLRYLPVRIRLRQDESTFIDLVIARKPELASP